MFCKYCGSKLIDGAAFCHECGKSAAEAPAPQVSVAPVTPPVQPVYQQPVYQQPVIPQPVPPVQPVYQQPVATPPAQPTYQVPVYQQPVPPAYTYTFPPVQNPAPAAPAADQVMLEKLEQQALTLGILGLCLSMLGVPGLILSCIGSGKASKYKQLTGGLSAKARTGYKLAKAGKIVGIVMTALLAIIVPALLEGDVTYDYVEPFEYFDF